MLIISAYAKKGHVSHVHYEHGSILRFVEDSLVWLGCLRATRARSHPRPDCFDFSKPPRTVRADQSPVRPELFLAPATRSSAARYRVKEEPLASHPLLRAPLAIAAVALFVSACRGNDGLASFSRDSSRAAERPRASIQLAHHHGKIRHVVIIIQENRSFNNLFYGYPGAKTAKYGYDSKGEKIRLEPVTLATTWDLEHQAEAVEVACNGTGKIPGTDCRMNGFNKERRTCGRGGPRCPSKYPAYSYVPHSETKPYFDMAKQYVLADEMFASNFDSSSFISHQYIISGRNESAVNYPYRTLGMSRRPRRQDISPWSKA